MNVTLLVLGISFLALGEITAFYGVNYGISVGISVLLCELVLRFVPIGISKKTVYVIKLFLSMSLAVAICYSTAPLLSVTTDKMFFVFPGAGAILISLANTENRDLNLITSIKMFFAVVSASFFTGFFGELLGKGTAFGKEIKLFSENTVGIFKLSSGVLFLVSSVAAVYYLCNRMGEKDGT